MMSKNEIIRKLLVDCMTGGRCVCGGVSTMFVGYSPHPQMVMHTMMHINIKALL